ncbi:GNAT family N-acetyltransferase [Glaciecola siphonariae]|uniref:GNAT family N-acetyltransferase n=1 Tax=Glaciecola siphonariae TaxID=521012 RepID=A0ABV9LTP0_9ALTE
MQEGWQYSIITELADLSDKTKSSLSQSAESGEATPFLSFAFLELLSSSKSVDGDSGWYSHHLLIRDASQTSEEDKMPVVALVPCYLKTHSYGEYVFDHSWAHAYEQHGLAYYPKLVCAIPFTPVTGARALIDERFRAEGVSQTDVFTFINRHKQSILDSAKASSLHLLFSPQTCSDSLNSLGMHQRLSVQFVWSNDGYKSFDDFMAALTSRKRRSIRKERAPFADATPASEANTSSTIQINTLYGDALTQDVIDAFYLCYQQTYFKRSGHAGYLRAAFFDNLLTAMRDSVCIVAAFKQNEMIAGSLFFYNEHALFGRYWGALEEVSGLHFECCYYRGIDFAIKQNIQTFNPGTQGEHKILRGFRPTFCFSNHALLEPAFDKAVEDFVKRERYSIEQYHAQASEVLPYKQIEQSEHKANDAHRNIADDQ